MFRNPPSDPRLPLASAYRELPGSTPPGNSGSRRLLIPDLDEHLTAALMQTETILLAIAAWKDLDPGARWPEPAIGPAALAAVRRLWRVIAPSQGERALRGRDHRLFAPRGYEHVPLRLVPASKIDITMLGATAEAIAAESPDVHIRMALEGTAQHVYGCGHDQACAALAASTINLAALLSLAPDRDTHYLTALLMNAPVGDITLSGAGEAAYQRYATRASTAWQPSDPLHRWLY